MLRPAAITAAAAWIKHLSYFSAATARQSWAIRQFSFTVMPIKKL
jgi:hypothetical protein